MAGVPVGAGNLFLPQFLNNFMISYMQDADQFAADRVSPRVPVPKRSGDYIKWDKAEDFRVDTIGVRRPGDKATLIDVLKSNGLYNCTQYGKRVQIPDELVNDAMGIVNIQLHFATELAQQMLKMREYRTAALATTQANYASANKGTPIAVWNDYITAPTTYTSNPFMDITKALEAILSTSGVRPNKIEIPVDIAVYLRQHPEFIKRYSSWTGTVEGGMDLPPKILGMDVVIPGAYRTTNNRNVSDTATLGTIWGNNVVMYYVADTQLANVGPNTLCSFKSFDYTVERTTDSWYDKDTHSTIIESHETIDEEIVAADTAYLLHDVIA